MPKQKGTTKGDETFIVTGVPEPEWSMFTEPVLFEPGDGDRYYIFARSLHGLEAKKFNASEGDVLLFVNYSRDWAVMPLTWGSYFAATYVMEKLGKGFNLRVASAFYEVAGYVMGRDLQDSPRSCDFVDWRQMGWKLTWRDDLTDLRDTLIELREP